MTGSNRRWIAMLTIAVGAGASGFFALRIAPTEQNERATVEATANTWTSSTQYEPAIAADADGEMLVAWASRRQEDGAYGVYAQLFDPLGRPIGVEVHVNQVIEGGQVSPAAAFDPTSGRALVVWETSHQDGDGAGIVGRWFETSPFGAHPVTDEFPVNEQRAGDQSKPSVAIDSSGRAIVAWTTNTDGGATSSAARFIGADGEPLSAEFVIGPSGAHTPILGASADGFLVVGSATTNSGRPAPLWVQRIERDGAAGEIIAVAETSGAMDIEPSLGVNEAGDAVVAWMRRGDRGYDVMRRSFHDSGRPVGPERTVAAQSGEWLAGAAVAVAPDGRSIVSWNIEERTPPAPSNGVGRKSRPSNIVARRFDASGEPLGEPERVNIIAEGRQRLPSGAATTRTLWTGLDQIAHAWHGRTERDSSGVGVTISYPADLTAPEPIAFEPKPAFTHEDLKTEGHAASAPVWDPDFVPEPPDLNVRGVGPDFGFLGAQNTGWRPPDPEVAVGPDHVVVVVNSRVFFRRKIDGVQTFSQNLTGGGGFWGAQGAGGFVFDPIAQYDTYSDRFVIAASERDGSQQYIDVAISDDDDPNGAWNKFRINVTSFGGDIDFPNLGIDEDAIYVTADFFSTPFGNWIFIIDKADLIAGALTMQGVQSAGGPNVLGVMTNYDAGSPAQYFATTYFGGSNQILLKAVTDPLGSPTLHEHVLTVPSYNQPPGADQLGSTNLVSTVDFRIKHGVVRNGSMWVAHNTNDPDGDGPFSMDPIARVRWHEIDLNGWPTSGGAPSIAQSGTINAGEGVHTYFPDISVDEDGNAAMVICRSSSDEFVSVARVVRRASDPAGTFRQPVLMQTSTTPEQEDRWGDYAGVQEDPVEPGVFWGHSEYRTASWRTWVGRFSPQTPNPIDFVLLAPTDGAAPVSVAPTLEWEDAEDADSYEVTIATDAALVNTVTQTTVSGPSWSVPADALDCETTYHWSVVASGVGGLTSASPGVFSFTTGLLADLNADNIVDTSDLGILIGEFGGPGPTSDLNGDGVVDTSDLGVLIGAFGATCD